MRHVRGLLHKPIQSDDIDQEQPENVKDWICKKVLDLYEFHSSFRYSATILLAISASAQICYYVRAFIF